MLRTLFPLETAASFTLRLFGGGIAACALIAIAALLLRRLSTREPSQGSRTLPRWSAASKARRLPTRLAKVAAAGVLLVAGGWAFLHATKPAWLRAALATPVPAPRSDFGGWTARAPGLETGDIELTIDGRWIDHIALCRLDPRRYRFTVHWDATRSRTVEEWQQALGASLVINGSYFLPDGSPQTPLRLDGRAAGPARYTSLHGGFVAGDGVANGVAILDLKGKDVLPAIAPFPQAMVSYPLLLDEAGEMRAPATREWLASRTFIALDGEGRVVVGTTRSGFFTLRRLGEYLKASPLDVRVALNFDGGPIASQIVKTDAFERVTIGNAEITDGGDVARVWWQAHRTSRWRLPIVLAATPRETDAASAAGAPARP